MIDRVLSSIDAQEAASINVGRAHFVRRDLSLYTAFLNEIGKDLFELKTE